MDSNDILLGGGTVIFVVVCFLFVLAVLWFILPFIIWSMNTKLRRLIEAHATQTTELKAAIVELRNIVAQVEGTNVMLADVHGFDIETSNAAVSSQAAPAPHASKARIRVPASR